MLGPAERRELQTCYETGTLYSNRELAAALDQRTPGGKDGSGLHGHLIEAV
jgi:hypothetical protein